MNAQTAPLPDADCSRCDAVCCRLTVVLQSEDRIPPRFTTHTAAGLHVMDRDQEGWCVAIDAARMQCSIYDIRPEICRRFVMAGPYCREVRADYSDRNARGIPLQLYQETGVMPSPKKPHPAGAAPPAIAPSKTSHLFAPRKANDRTPVTREAIEADMEAFRKAGGKIEVLGITRALHRIDADPNGAPPPAPAKPTSSRGR